MMDDHLSYIRNFMQLRKESTKKKKEKEKKKKRRLNFFSGDDHPSFIYKQDCRAIKKKRFSSFSTSTVTLNLVWGEWGVVKII